MNKIIYKDFDIDLKYNKKLKNTYISIVENNKILIKTPVKSSSFLLKLLEERENWIRKQFIKISQYKTYNINLEDEVLLFGEVYSIDASEATYLRERLPKIKNSTKAKIEKCYDAFYKYISQEYLQMRTDYFSELMNLKYETLKYRKMKSRWGSCSSKKVITLNSELMKVDKRLIDYVIVHELAHLTHMNHSKNFHALVESYLPNSQALRKELKAIRLF